MDRRDKIIERGVAELNRLSHEHSEGRLEYLLRLYRAH